MCPSVHIFAGAWTSKATNSHARKARETFAYANEKSVDNLGNTFLLEAAWKSSEPPRPSPPCVEKKIHFKVRRRKMKLAKIVILVNYTTC